MAFELAGKSGESRYNGRMTPFVVLSCLVAATGGVIFGYDLGISGGVTSMEPFLEKFFPKVYERMRENSQISNYCKFDSQLLTAFTSSLYIAGLFASFFASSITDSFGRKVSMLIGGAAFFAGAALGGAAVNVYMLIFGRILLVFGVAFTNQSALLYLSEIAPPQYRGGANNAFEVFVGIGILVANNINFGTQKIHAGWGCRVSLAAAAIPAIFLSLGTLFLPETPNSLLQHDGNLEKATEKLQKLRGTTDVHEELTDIIAASTISKTTSHHPFRLITQKKYRPQLVMAILIPFFQQVTGINVITFYAPIIFRTIGLEESASLMSAVVTGLVSTVCCVMAMVLVDRLGRRPLFFIGGFLMLVAHIALGAVLATELEVEDQGGMSKGYAYLVLILSCVYVAGFGVSWGPLAGLVPIEIFPLEIRSAGQSIVVAVGFLFIFIFAQTFLAILCHLQYGTFFFFAGWVTIMTVFVYMFLPETKDLPIEQMDRIWRDHWFWKRIVEVKVEERNMDVMSFGNSQS